MLVTALRPARAGILLPVAVVLALAIVLNVVLDVVNGSATLASELIHLPELASVVLLWLLQRARIERGAVSEGLAPMEWRPGGTWTWSRLAAWSRRRLDGGAGDGLRAAGEDAG